MRIPIPGGGGSKRKQATGQRKQGHLTQSLSHPRSLCSRCGPALGLELGGSYSDWPRGLSSGVHEKRCE